MHYQRSRHLPRPIGLTTYPLPIKIATFVTGSPPISVALLLLLLLLLLVLSAGGSDANAALQFERVRSLGFSDRQGQYPVTPILLGTDGALYGTTPAGGEHGAGTVFKVNPNGTGYTVLRALGPGGERGRPQSGLLEGNDGALYGMTAAGGDDGEGTVFKLNKDGTGYAVLHSFSSARGDGRWGAGELIEGDDGALYGVTCAGGAAGGGTIFRIAKDGTSFRVLHDFVFKVGGTDGGGARAGLIKASDGILFGTTTQGGRSGVGTVFRLNQDGSGYAVLYSFGDTPDDGYGPHARLEEGSDGFLYGAAAYGGAGPVGAIGTGHGAIFKIGKDGAGYTVLHRFTGSGGDGSVPMGGLLEGADGCLFGTASAGGTNRIGGNSGVLFKLNKDGTGFQTLHTFGFSETDGGRPSAPLVQDSAGFLYGTTQLSGNTAGTVFKLKPDGTEYENIVRFGPGSGDAIRPGAALLESKDGFLYGTTSSGGSNMVGTVFRMAKNGTGYALLHHFPANEGDGYRPEGPLVEAEAGFLYGTTSCGGENNLGTVFRLSKDGSSYAILHHFVATSTNGSSYGARVILGFASGGSLFGCTRALGAFEKGSVFKINGDGFQTLHDFNLSPNDGFWPQAGVIHASDGNLYGTTQDGGGTFGGTIYSINMDGASYRIVYAFDALRSAEGGNRPQAGVIEAHDGALYGTTSSGGKGGHGTVFRINKDGTGFTVLHDFSAAESSFANDSLVEGIDGALYGTTHHGGSLHGGTIYRVNKDGSGFSLVAEFGFDFPEMIARNGSDLSAPLILGSDGALYGTTAKGGDMEFPGFGTLFRILRSETPRLTAVSMAGGVVEIGLIGQPGCQYRLMRSTDLSTWTPVATTTMPDSGSATVVDHVPGHPNACYRGVWQP